MSKQPTILDIAKKSGYSKSTVSLVLQNHPRIPEETKAEVLKAAKKLGYRRNRFAGSLRSNRSHVVGMVIQDHLNPFYAEVVEHAERRLQEHGYDLIVASSGTDLDREEQTIERLSGFPLDGLIASTTDYERVAKLLESIQSRGTHCVVAGPPAWAIPFDCVTMKAGPAVRAVMAHLVQLGHRDIGFIWGAPVFQGIDTRFDVFCHALETAGLAMRPGWVKHCGHQIKDGYEAAKSLLAGPDRPTAVLALNDLLAIATMRAAQDLALAVPGDVSVIGVDNIELSAYMRPSLTTVSQPIADYAHALTDLVLQGIEHKGQKRPPTRLELTAEVLIRESTGPARRGR